MRSFKSEKYIRSFFEKSHSKVYTPQVVGEIIDDHRGEWLLPATPPIHKLLDRFVSSGILEFLEIKFTNEKSFFRYTFGSPSVYEIACSLYPKSYISHYPSVYLHGLTYQVPKTIYATHELTAKNTENKLTQERIDTAFSKPQRRPETKAVYQDYNIILLNGMFTGLLGVTPYLSPVDYFAYTNLERTLIDITVRPNYAGGCFAVLEAYKKALDQQLSVNKLAAILNNIAFTYPYLQAVGFYLEKAGYAGNLLSSFRNKNMEFNFYLDYDMEKPVYSPVWKLYYPNQM